MDSIIIIICTPCVIPCRRFIISGVGQGGGAGGATAPPTFESGGGSAPPHFLDMKEIVSYFSMSATNGEQLNQNFCLRLHQKLSEHENTKKISGGHAPRPP